MNDDVIFDPEERWDYVEQFYPTSESVFIGNCAPGLREMNSLTRVRMALQKMFRDEVDPEAKVTCWMLGGLWISNHIGQTKIRLQLSDREAWVVITGFGPFEGLEKPIAVELARSAMLPSEDYDLKPFVGVKS